LKIFEKPILGIHENIAKNLVFIDGLSRTGKSCLSGIVSSLRNVEHFQTYTMIQYITQSVHLKNMDPHCAKAILRMNMNELSYNNRIGRSANLRPNDQTGIDNYRDPELYRKRLSRIEGDDVLRELRTDGRKLPLVTRDLLAMLEDLNKLDLDYLMLELFRHPIDTVYSWWKQERGDRGGNDDRAWTLTLDHEGEQVPWYCQGYEEEWLALNAVDRCAQMVLDLLWRSTRQYLAAPHAENILVIKFEEFAQRPHEELKRICEFLKTEQTPETDLFIQKARCPRSLDLAAQQRKLAEMKPFLNQSLLSLLLETSEQYDKNLMGLRT
jgi:hypothetical protein